MAVAQATIFYRSTGGIQMRWDQIETDWKSYQKQAGSQWNKINNEQLSATGGKREKLAAKIQEVYAVSKDEAEKQIKAFEDKAQSPQAPKPSVSK
jgi:uncharacterized protein YjbJ (UPF0337 family)